MKKKTLTLILTASMLATLSACGSTNTADNTANTPSTEVVASIDTELMDTETEATEEVIAESTEEATETEETEATEEVIAESTEEATETEETEETEVVADTPVETPAFTVADMSATKYAKSSVNVRKGPSSDYDRVGGLNTNQQVTVTGQADNGWYRISLNGTDGFVSNNYLVDEKVAVAANPTPAPGTTPDENAPVSDDNANVADGNGNKQTTIVNGVEVIDNRDPNYKVGELTTDGCGVNSRPATEEETNWSLEHLPEGATNVTINSDGSVSGDVPRIRP